MRRSSRLSPIPTRNSARGYAVASESRVQLRGEVTVTAVSLGMASETLSATDLRETGMTDSDIAHRVAQTYDHPSYEDAYDAVKDYRRARQAATDAPDKGSYALAETLGLPRARIRGWVDENTDTMPDAARALSVARDMEWLEPRGDTALALATIAGHLLGGGSIAAGNYVPSVCEGRNVLPGEIERAFQAVGVGSTRRHERSDKRATEVLPAEYASILGRTLSAWGCPVGGRNNIRSPPELIEYLGDAGCDAFLQAYVSHRAVTCKNKATSRLQGEQPEPFHRAIAELLSTSTAEPVSYGTRGVTVSAAAMRALGFAE